MIAQRPLRLRAGVVFVALQWLCWLVVPLVAPDASPFALLGAMVCGVAVFVWWLFFSRAPWAERLGAIAVMVLVVIATRRVVHPSLSNGMMGLLVPVYSIPILSLALVVWAVATRTLQAAPRRAWMVSAIAIACATLTLLRTDGVSGAGDSDFHWRWTPTAEQRLLAQARTDGTALPPASDPVAARASDPAPAGSPVAPAAAPASIPQPSAAAASAVSPVPTVAAVPPATAPEWPGFRGPARDGAARGARIDVDWARHPPVEMWRRPIGPGWSSFSVAGDLIYTQEQRGDDEVVSCYRLSSGEPVWAHRDAVRFWESNAGAGPRATPTIDRGRVYAFGATGIVNALDARTGAVIWSRNAATETKKKVPEWGFSSSPLVAGDLVVIAVSGQLVAYDAATGAPRWTGPTRGGGYSSPHLVTIDGVPQVVLLSGGGAMGVAPADGALLWEHAWESGASIVQPALADRDILLTGAGTMGAIGLRRLALARDAGRWTVTERWTTRGLKPYFNDFVVHKGHAYGFDGSILAAIDLADGTRTWKGGRYGSGQMILLPDQDVLLVVSEEGDLALVKAAPDQFTELARVPAIAGKTWNHPVLVGGVLLVRNGEEMTAWRVAGVR